MSSEQLAQRVKMGDHLDLAREVDHFAYFRHKAEADAAAKELLGDGYRVSISRKKLTYHLVAHTESSLEPSTVDDFVRTEYELINRHGGIYDGWGGPIVQQREEST
jgi:regulator of RNase E activity RraB